MESNACAGKDTQGVSDHNTVFGEVNGMNERMTYLEVCFPNLLK